MRERVVLVEGGDETCIFPRIMDAVLDSDGGQIHEEKGPFECGSTVFTYGTNAIQFSAVGGRTKFDAAVNLLLKQAERNNIHLRSLGIVCDSDDDPAKSLNLLQKALEARLPVPKSHASFAGRDPTVGMFLLPDGGSAGSLDTLCRKSVADDIRVDCVDSYLNCLKGLGKPVKNDDKSFVFAYSVAVGQQGDRAGSLARRGELNLDHEAFGPLAEFLQELLFC